MEERKKVFRSRQLSIWTDIDRGERVSIRVQKEKLILFIYLFIFDNWASLFYSLIKFMCCLLGAKHCFKYFININSFNYYYYYFTFQYKLLLLFFLLCNALLVLPYININPPQVYISSNSWTPLPPPSLYHPSGLPQCTSPQHPVSCIEPKLGIRFLYDITRFNAILPNYPALSLSHRVKKSSVHLRLLCCLAYRVIVTIFLNSIYMC